MPSPARKLFWLACWVVGFAVGMTGLLLHFKYQSVFTGLQRDRILLVAREIDEIADLRLHEPRIEREPALREMFESRAERIAAVKPLRIARERPEHLGIGVP